MNETNGCSRWFQKLFSNGKQFSKYDDLDG